MLCGINFFLHMKKFILWRIIRTIAMSFFIHNFVRITFKRYTIFLCIYWACLCTCWMVTLGWGWISQNNLTTFFKSKFLWSLKICCKFLFSSSLYQNFRWCHFFRISKTFDVWASCCIFLFLIHCYKSWYLHAMMNFFFMIIILKWVY